MPTPPPISIHFNHGLGDAANFARMIPLYTKRGYQFEIQCQANKRFLFEAVGAKIVAKASKPHGWPFPDVGLHAGLGRGWTGNKPGCNLSRPPLPELGSRDELWEDYKAVEIFPRVRQRISQPAWTRIEKSLEGLPQPIVLLHTIGNTSREHKSLPEKFHVPFYRGLLDRFEGTLILLDWDRRMPRLAHYRVRYHPDQFGNLTTEDLLALMFESDLLIGVDSGPLHLAAMTDLPAVGVCQPRHYVASHLVPWRRVLNIVLAGHTGRWNRYKRAEFRIVEHPGKEFDPERLAAYCTQMLKPRRYLPNHCPIADDLLLQHLTREFCRGQAANKLSPVADRNHSFDVLLQEAQRRFPAPRVVETGCIRAEEDWKGAGFSTYLFALWIQANGGELDSVDLNPKHCQFARKWTAFSGSRVRIHEGRGEDWLRSGREEIDILYLDSVDTEIPSHARDCLAEFQAALPRLHDSSLVLIDDTPFDGQAFTGKGSEAVPWALQHGWRILYGGYQILLSR